MRIVKITFLCLLLPSYLIAQNDGSYINKYINELKEKSTVPELNKEAMYADIDTLVAIMERCNPQYLVRKKVTGYDIIEEIKAQRKEVKNCNTALDFSLLLEKILSYTLDLHCYSAGMEVFMYQFSLFKRDIAANDITKADFGINFHYRDNIGQQYPPLINLIYVQGKYYLKNTTTFFNGVDSIVLPFGTEIFTFNQKPIADIQPTFRKWYSRWDYDKNWYYYSTLYVTSPQNSIGFNIDNTIKEYDFEKITKTLGDYRIDGYHVKWFAQDSVIYMTVPQMIYNKRWLKQLKSELLNYKKNPVQSVIIDIRGNDGGNDKVWEEVLGMISKISIKFPSYFISTTDKEVLKRAQPLGQNYLPQKECSKRVIECIDPNYQFRVFSEETNVIKSHTRNLGYTGTIYLLVDEGIYSSAGALSSLCTKNDRIKTIGMPTGMLLGRGINPSVFILPNSRLIFKMELLLDAAGVSKAEDFYHDQISYPVTPSIEYYKYWYDPARSYTIDEKTMYECDEVFIKALEIIKSQK
jgi:hypothetical protein